MQFAVQRYLEDKFNSQGLVDPDQFAIKFANVYTKSKANNDNYEQTVSALSRISSGFYKANGLNRADFLAPLIRRLDRKFKKKTYLDFPGGVERERKYLKQKRRTIRNLLELFRRAVESRAVDEFWRSRTANRLRQKPESIAQTLLSVFLTGVLDGKGLVLREFQSGSGYVDVGVVLSSTLHLVELKVLRDKLTGPSQLGRYMELENRKEGWLFLIDARLPNKRVEVVPNQVETLQGRVRIVRADIHPIAPSRL